MQLNLHQTHHEIGDFEGVFQYLTQNLKSDSTDGIHLFPELFLTGYPLQDLVLRKSFIDEYLSLLNDISLWSKTQFKTKHPVLALFGGLRYFFDSEGLPAKIENVIYQLTPGKELEHVYTKQLLPNYDLYEEKKYFTAGNETKILDFQGKKIALLVCEDMWFSHLHSHDPVEDLKNENEFIDLIVNFSGSPFHIDKEEKRVLRAKQISKYLKAPFAYINRIGMEDEILFDGQSFVVNGDLLIKKSQAFKSDILSIALMEYRESGVNIPYSKNANSWEEIYQARVDRKTNKLLPLGSEKCELILNGMMFGIYDYARKNNMHNFTIALSGGMDSAIVVTIIKLMMNKYQEINHKKIELEAVFMPGFFSSSLSFDLSYDLCRNLGIKLTTLPIKFIHSTIRNTYRDNFQSELKGLADENIQSRLRGSLIYARSNEIGSMILNTSNKSELSVGYSTLYGDSVGALSVLGDLYKSEVYELAEYINQKTNGIIPIEIITRPPSAELRENQVDTESLPPYEILDPILEYILSMRYSTQDIIQMGFDRDQVNKVFSLYSKSEYKRRQFCPIMKLKPKSFGFGYRIPICKRPF